ncbi:fimbria/pilus periplasmic chaperone [Scandinavium sp.]|uniref:fimbria/pilus periplasmic chaperone n=1 Tax=Scandinavium sp. TaxID=2830653 RepID=UPI0028972F42|nr:fimbria/pilus periplasmic chaperone [Scandinavium sp.]
MLPLSKMLIPGFFLILFAAPSLVHADGIVLGGTRIVYPAGQKQTSISVRNTSNQSRYLVQSWIEDAGGKKTNDFILTPPLYVSNPGNENTLRLMFSGPSLAEDRETLYYLTAKAVPAVEKNKTDGKNTLLLAAATRIKVFYRPKNLPLQVEAAPSKLTFTRQGKNVVVNNPTPYYITLVQMKVSGIALRESPMVPPFGQESFTLPEAKGGAFSFETMNDYGGMSKTISTTL